MKATEVQEELKKHMNAEKAAFFPHFFKSGPGEYGEGDQFMGVIVPDQRRIAKKFIDLPFSELQVLLNSPLHEQRQTALFIMTYQYPKADTEGQQHIYDFYLYNAKKDCVNNWDLVDSSAHKIVGFHLLNRDRTELHNLANTGSLWLERIAMIATLTFIKNQDFGDTLLLSKKFLTHKHDLMHKATGWMLREVGKQDEKALREFLDEHAPEMPRTMLRYSLERLPKPDRLAYMNK